VIFRESDILVNYYQFSECARKELDFPWKYQMMDEDTFLRWIERYFLIKEEKSQ